MTNDFEIYLTEKMCETWHGPDDDAIDAFDAWLQNLTIEDWLKYGEAYGKICKELK